MAQLVNPTIDAKLRAGINRVVKGIGGLNEKDTAYFARKFGVQPETLTRWFDPKSKAEMLPKSAQGKQALSLVGEWRNRAVLGLMLLGRLASTSPATGKYAKYTDKETRNQRSLEPAFDRVLTYLQYSVDGYLNEAWRSLRVSKVKGQWLLQVAYQRIPSPQEEEEEEELEEDWELEEEEEDDG